MMMDYNLNIYIKDGIRPLLIIQKIGQDPLGIDLSKSLNKKELGKSLKSFDIFCRFLKYKKIEDEYYNKFLDIYNGIIMLKKDDMVENLNDLLSLFNDDDILNFLKFEDYKTPNLPEEFDNNKLINKEVTREQSYTKGDYLLLVKLIMKLKAVIPIISRYISIMNIDTNDSSALIIYHIISKLKMVAEDEAFIKLVEFIDKNINRVAGIDESTISRVLNKNITKESFIPFVGVSVLIYLGIAATPDSEDDRPEIVSNIYRLCMNKTASSKNILINKPKQLTDDDGSNSSVTDAYTSVTQLAIGHTEEIKEYFGTREMILMQLERSSIRLDLNILNSLDSYRTSLAVKIPDVSQEVLICWIFFNILERNYLDLLDKQTAMMELRLIAAAILYTNEFDMLGDIMMSSTVNDGVYVNKPSNKKCEPNIEEMLDSVYSIAVNKKPRSRQYGLSLLDDSVADADSGLKELLIKPMIKRLSSNRWYNHMRPEGDVFEYTSPREDLIRLLALLHVNIEIIK